MEEEKMFTPRRKVLQELASLIFAFSFLFITYAYAQDGGFTEPPQSSNDDVAIPREDFNRTMNSSILGSPLYSEYDNLPSNEATPGYENWPPSEGSKDLGPNPGFVQVGNTSDTTAVDSEQTSLPSTMVLGGTGNQGDRELVTLKRDMPDGTPNYEDMGAIKYYSDIQKKDQEYLSQLLPEDRDIYNNIRQAQDANDPDGALQETFKRIPHRSGSTQLNGPGDDPFISGNDPLPTKKYPETPDDGYVGER